MHNISRYKNLPQVIFNFFFLTTSMVTLEINIQAADIRRQKLSDGSGLEVVHTTSAHVSWGRTQFHGAELSFMAQFTATEAEKCGRLCALRRKRKKLDNLSTFMF